MTIWTDNKYEQWGVGDVGFVAEWDDTNSRTEGHDFERGPFRKNLSHEPILVGWCGSTNNVSTTALGVGVVTRITNSGDRMRIKMLHGDDLTEALDNLGWPDLAAA